MSRIVWGALVVGGCLAACSSPPVTPGPTGGGSATGGGAAAGGASGTGGSTGTGGGSSNGADAGSFACDVGPVLQARCADCHAATPRFGAPMPLVSYADTQADSAQHPGQKVYQRIAVRVADDALPMPQPPNPRLAAHEQASIAAWAAAGAPQGDAAQCGDAGTVFVPDAGMDVPGCPAGSTKIDIVAPGFQIPAASDFYQCFAQTVRVTGKQHVIKLDKLIDDDRVLHHVVLFRDLGKNAPASKGNCGVEQDWQALYAWGPGAGPLNTPADVGLPINDGDQLVIQIHYNNSTNVTGTDSSGAYICSTPTLRPKEAGVMAIGPVQFDLPPNCQRATSMGTCQNNGGLTVPQNTTYDVFTVWPHMHLRGRAMKTVLKHNGVETVVTDRPNYSFNAQYLESASFKFAPGDSLETRCWWDTSGATGATKWGEDTTDEMCFNFLYLVPPPAIGFGGNVQPLPFCPPTNGKNQACE